MHEAAMAERILEISLRVSEEHGNLPIRRVQVHIGELQAVVPEALESAFDAGKQETPAAEAELNWTTIAARVLCGECGGEYVPDDVFWVCPDCGSPRGEALSGNELTVMEVELDSIEGENT